MTPLEATVFALGIHEDTGSLTYPTATQRDAEALAWCLRHGARQEMVSRYLHAPLGEDERALLDALLASLETHGVAGVELLLAAVAWPTYVDGVSNLAHKVVDLTDSRALVCLVEMEGRVVAVFRSRTPEVDTSVLARGARRRRSSSGVVRDVPRHARRGPGCCARRASARRCASRSRRLRSCRAPRASCPPTTRSPTRWCCASAIARAVSRWARPSSLTGVVSREDLDKAIGHGLSHAPVKAIMGSELVTCSEEAPLAELARLVATAHAGRVPVLRDGEVVGVVTRSDVLRALGEPVPEAPPASGVDVGRELRALPDLQPVFDAIQAVSLPFEGVYLVGGTVRDILLGETGFDLDIAVEGDGIALARALAGELGGRVVPHEKFGTGVVRWPGGRVDVATTRTEFYDEPGALPAVEQAPILQDLYRRDFTINAMAVSLRGEDFGRLVDPFDGLADLRSGRCSRPPRPVVHRRSDAHLPRRPVREPVRVPHGRAHDGARPRVRRDGPRRGALLGPAAGGAQGAAVRGRGG